MKEKGEKGSERERGADYKGEKVELIRIINFIYSTFFLNNVTKCFKKRKRELGEDTRMKRSK